MIIMSKFFLSFWILLCILCNAFNVIIRKIKFIRKMFVLFDLLFALLLKNNLPEECE
jgi:hypothetical protein